MTWQIEQITHVKDITHWPITVPNGSLTFAKKNGRIKIWRYLVLEDVYLIPQLRCNLLSIFFQA